MQLVFEQIRSGGDRNFGYLLGDRTARRGVLIDPSFSPATFVARAHDQGLTVTHVINTHSHVDHTNGNADAVAATGAATAWHPGAPAAPRVALADGATLDVGVLRLRFLHVPGHCADHLVVYEATHRLLITGDLIFVGKVGGTANDDDARTEWLSLQRVLDQVPGDATVWPGHDYGVRPSSTIALERQTNPFLRCATLDDFLTLKRDWPIFKKEYGLK